MAEFDRSLLAATGRDRPRVVILPTASAPDGDAVFRRWAAMGVAHFEALGAEVEPVLIRDRADAADESCLQAIGEADLIYLSGGSARHARRVLVGSPAGDALLAAHARGAVVAGCSAGAMVLADRLAERRRWRLPFPLAWAKGLGLVAGVAVVPDYDAWPEPFAAVRALQAPRHTVVIGIDGATAAVGRDGTWQVHGRGRVTVWRGRHRDRYRRGELFRL